jgi:hypothetical protein
MFLSRNKNYYERLLLYYGARMYIGEEAANKPLKINLMKIHPESREIDLYVASRKMTEKESKELSEFIKQIKLKKKLVAKKSSAKKKVKVKVSLNSHK